MEDAEVAGRVHPSEQVAEDRERPNGNHGESGRESVEPVGQIHGVRARRRHERHEREVDRPRQHPDDVFKERELGRVRVDAAGEGEQQDIDTESNAERHLADELPARDESLRLAPHDLQIVVQKADQSHPQRRRDRHDDVATVEPRPQQRGNDRRQNNDQGIHAAGQRNQ